MKINNLTTTVRPIQGAVLDRFRNVFDLDLELRVQISNCPPPSECGHVRECSILDKMGAKDGTQATIYALKRGLVDLE